MGLFCIHYSATCIFLLNKIYIGCWSYLHMWLLLLRELATWQSSESSISWSESKDQHQVMHLEGTVYLSEVLAGREAFLLWEWCLSVWWSLSAIEHVSSSALSVCWRRRVDPLAFHLRDSYISVWKRGLAIPNFSSQGPDFDRMEARPSCLPLRGLCFSVWDREGLTCGISGKVAEPSQISPPRV